MFKVKESQHEFHRESNSSGARQRRSENSARIRPIRTLRGAEEIAHWRQHRTRRYARSASHLQDRGHESPTIRWSADGRLHRRFEVQKHNWREKQLKSERNENEKRKTKW